MNVRDYDCRQVRPSRDNPTESEIQALIAEQDYREACDKACSAYRGKVVAYCIKELHGYVCDPEADAEEIAQEVFLAFWRALRTGQYKPALGDVKTFLFTITKRRVIDKLRTPNKSIPGRDAELDELERRDLRDSHATNPESILLAHEQRESLVRGLSELDDFERTIINLQHQYDYSTAKIAHMTGKTSGSIRTQLSRTRGKLRKICSRDV